MCIALAALAVAAFACSSGEDSAVDTSVSTATADSKASYERLLRSIVTSGSPSVPPGELEKLVGDGAEIQFAQSGNMYSVSKGPSSGIDVGALESPVEGVDVPPGGPNASDAPRSLRLDSEWFTQCSVRPP
jgi:hypothetical protein